MTNVITVYQPYASLIMAGVKTWETRGNPPHGDMIWFNYCWHGDDEESPCEWGYCWALDGDPEEFLALAMDLLREGWEPEEVVPVVDDETREDVLDAVRHAKDTLTEVAVRYPSWGSELRLAGRTLDALAAAYLGRND